MGFQERPSFRLVWLLRGESLADSFVLSWFSVHRSSLRFFFAYAPHFFYCILQLLLLFMRRGSAPSGLLPPPHPSLLFTVVLAITGLSLYKKRDLRTHDGIDGSKQKWLQLEKRSCFPFRVGLFFFRRLHFCAAVRWFRFLVTERSGTRKGQSDVKMRPAMSATIQSMPCNRLWPFMALQLTMRQWCVSMASNSNACPTESRTSSRHIIVKPLSLVCVVSRNLHLSMESMPSTGRLCGSPVAIPDTSHNPIIHLDKKSDSVNPNEPIVQSRNFKKRKHIKTILSYFFFHEHYSQHTAFSLNRFLCSIIFLFVFTF